MSHLDGKINHLLAHKRHLKANRNAYLNNLKEMLDLYLLSVMEEEDPLYNLLHQHSTFVCHGYHNMKVLAPFCIQIKILMSLPFHENQVQVEHEEPGYVKLKLPANVGEEVTSSKVWRDACNRGIQKSLLRHINFWRDDDYYLKSTSFLKWFGGVVDKSLEITGSIPNYKIQRSQSRGKIVLDVDDLKKNLKIGVVLLPVLSFPVSQLPANLSGVPEDPTCAEWMVECRSNALLFDPLWGISLWQHERLIIKNRGKLKPLIYVLKSLRDGCGWTLHNYQLRTLVMLSYRDNPTIFQNLAIGDLLLHLLLELRNRLVSREGLPFFWENNCDLLCGLTGKVKSGMARAVTQTRDRLQRPDTDFEMLFRPEVYMPIVPLESSYEASPSGSPVSPSTLSEFPLPGTPVRASSQQPKPPDDQPQPMAQPENQDSVSEHDIPRLQQIGPQPPRGVNGTRQAKGRNWWTVGIAGAGAFAVSVLAGFAMARPRNQQKS